MLLSLGVHGPSDAALCLSIITTRNIWSVGECHDRKAVLPGLRVCGQSLLHRFALRQVSSGSSKSEEAKVRPDGIYKGPLVCNPADAC